MTTSPTQQDALATTARLKADIDAGRTGDKVANADPGLSPLGTDDEAAGTPASPEQIALARTHELKQGIRSGPPVEDTRRSGVSIWVMVAIVVVIAAVIVGVVISR